MSVLKIMRKKRKTFLLHEEYLIMTNDLLEATLLSYIEHMFSENDRIVEKQEEEWFQFTRIELSDELKVSKKILDRVLKALEEKELIESKVMRDEEGITKKHVRLLCVEL